MNHQYTPEFLVRFWAKVDRRDPDQCWNWTASTSSDGYGRIGWKHSLLAAHRVSYQLHFGPFSDENKVLHTCDNPPCVNPDHLWLGTDKDNAQDRQRKGRGIQHRGEKHANHKITDAQVCEIRKRYADGSISLYRLAREYGVSAQQIWYIVHNKQRQLALE